LISKERLALLQERAALIPHEPHKTCTKCGVVQPLTAFKTDKRNTDGKRSECRDCTNVYRRSKWIRRTARNVKRSALMCKRRPKQAKKPPRVARKKIAVCPVCNKPKADCARILTRKARKPSKWLLVRLHLQALTEDSERDKMWREMSSECGVGIEDRTSLPSAKH